MAMETQMEHKLEKDRTNTRDNNWLKNGKMNLTRNIRQKVQNNW
jgi:hypothetical protein